MDAYEQFKLQWMKDHGCTVSDLVKSVIRFAADRVEKRDNLFLMNTDALVEEWERDSGFSGSIWPCRAEWEDCEAQEPKPPQTIRLPIAPYDSLGNQFTLTLTAEEINYPEFGPEVVIGLTDENNNRLQNLVLVRERDFDLRPNGKESAIEVLLWKDENSEDYTDREKIKIYPVLMDERELPDSFFSEDSTQKCPGKRLDVTSAVEKKKPAMTPEEALVRSMTDKGKVDMQYMETLVGNLTPDEIEEALKGMIFLLPELLDDDGYGHYVTAGPYLSGTPDELEKRLSEARNAAEMSAAFDANVIALQKNLCGMSFAQDMTSIRHIETLGGWFDKYGIPHFDAEVFVGLQYTGDSVKFPGKKTLMIPTEMNGPTLITEKINFVIDNKKEERKE